MAADSDARQGGADRRDRRAAEETPACDSGGRIFGGGYCYYRQKNSPKPLIQRLRAILHMEIQLPCYCTGNSNHNPHRINLRQYSELAPPTSP